MKLPLGEKFALTVPEASAYFNISEVKLRKMTNREDCKFVIWVGQKRLIKRALFEEYLQELHHIA